jgi:hypothetical protein
MTSLLAPRTSLNVYLNWPQTAELLGLPLQEHALPARTHCPLCPNGQLTVYADPREGGAWFACRDCARSGDLIELTAACWGMSLPATLELLVRKGAPLPPEAVTPQRVDSDMRNYPDYRQRFLSLWQREQVWLLKGGRRR